MSIKFTEETNAKLLNRICHTNYKQWMKSIYPLNKNCYIWMIQLTGKQKYGWSNNMSNDYIIEDYDMSLPKPSNFEIGLTTKYRYVFEKRKKGNSQYFLYHGLYELINIENHGGKRTLKKAEDIDNPLDLH